MGFANDAVAQIIKKKYAVKLAGDVLAVGVGHYKKRYLGLDFLSVLVYKTLTIILLICF